MYTLIPISHHHKNHIYYSKDPSILSSNIWNELKNLEENKGTKSSIKSTIQKIFWSKWTLAIPSYVLKRNKIHRDTPVMSIWDLHGNYEALIENLRHSWLINEHKKWRGNNTQLVLHGDIFADRHADSIKIANYVQKLQEKAEKYDGKITLLAGNHEDILFALLTQQSIYNCGSLLRVDMNMSSARVWMQEIIDYAAQMDNSLDTLSALRSHEEWKNILEFMCNMQLLELIDDTLFVHVVPHDNMLDLIIKIGVEGINELYKKWMRYYLLGEWKLSIYEEKGFQDLRKLFLDTNHRKLPMPENEKFLKIKEMGISLVVSGHDSTNAGKYIEKDGVAITSADFKFHLKDKYTTIPSIVWIKQNGELLYGKGEPLVIVDSEEE